MLSFIQRSSGREAHKEFFRNTLNTLFWSLRSMNNSETRTFDWMWFSAKWGRHNPHPQFRKPESMEHYIPRYIPKSLILGHFQHNWACIIRSRWFFDMRFSPYCSSYKPLHTYNKQETSDMIISSSYFEIFRRVRFRAILTPLQME